MSTDESSIFQQLVGLPITFGSYLNIPINAERTNENNTANSNTKGKKIVDYEDLKSRHKERERLRWQRLKEAQQEIIALLPPMLQEQRRPQTLQMFRLVNYMAFLEVLLLISGNVNGYHGDENNFRLIKLLFGATYKQQLITAQSTVGQTEAVQVFNLEKLLIQLRQKISDVLKKDFHHFHHRTATKSKVDLVPNLNSESGLVSSTDNGDDHSSVDSCSNEGSGHPEAAQTPNWYFETPIMSHQSYPSSSESFGLAAACQLFSSYQIDSHACHIPSV